MKKSLLLLSSLFLLCGLTNVSVNAGEAGALLTSQPKAFEDTKFTHRVENDVDLFETDQTVSVSMKNYAKNFFRNTTQILLDNHDDFNNGVIFANKVKATDAYGNETKINNIILWISPETLEKINFENDDWGKSPEDLYNVADAVNMMSEVETNEFKQKDATDETPDAYFYLIAEGY